MKAPSYCESFSSESRRRRGDSVCRSWASRIRRCIRVPVLMHLFVCTRATNGDLDIFRALFAFHHAKDPERWWAHRSDAYHSPTTQTLPRNFSQMNQRTHVSASTGCTDKPMDKFSLLQRDRAPVERRGAARLFLRLRLGRGRVY